MSTAAFVPFVENGGFYATQYLLLVPATNTNGGNAYIATFSLTSYDDPNDGSSYSYRQEDVIVGRCPVIRRVILIYRNLGIATITATVTAVDDNGNVVNGTKTQQIGNASANGVILTSFFDLEVTGFRPQLTLSRKAGAGPLSVISATLVGEVEDTSL